MRLSTRTSARDAVDPGPATDRRGHRLDGAILGVVTAGVALAAGQLAGAFVAPPAAPLLAIGAAAVDASPEWLKSFAIQTFGPNDKTVLVLGIVIVVGGIAAIIGTWALQRPWVGFATIGLLGALGAAVAVARPGAAWTWLIPSAVATGRAREPSSCCFDGPRLRASARWPPRATDPVQRRRRGAHRGDSIGGGS